MATTIQVRRGLEINLPILSVGELAFTTDTHKTFIGDGTANHELSSGGSAGDGTLTVQGTGVLGGSGTFTANQSSNAIINITHDTVGTTNVDNSNGFVIQDVTFTNGHVSSLGSVDLDSRYYTETEIDTMLANSSSMTWSEKTSNYTVSKNEGIFADTSGGSFTITLPASPSIGDFIAISDYKESWETHNLTIARNGSNIEGLAQDLICDQNQFVNLTYSSASEGWVISAELMTYHDSNLVTLDMTNISPASWVLDEDDMSSNDDTKVPTQQSVKAYVDNHVPAEQWIIKSSNYTAISKDRIFADTSSAAFTITLPASPVIGDTIRINDLSGTFDTYNLTIGRNGNNINGNASNITCNLENATYILVYSNATYGWKYWTNTVQAIYG